MEKAGYSPKYQLRRPCWLEKSRLLLAMMDVPMDWTKLGIVAWQKASAHMVIGSGQVITGAVLSTTVTVKVQLELPTALVAVAVTVVVPTGKEVPGFWE